MLWLCDGRRTGALCAHPCWFMLFVDVLTRLEFIGIVSGVVDGTLEDVSEGEAPIVGLEEVLSIQGCQQGRFDRVADLRGTKMRGVDCAELLTIMCVLQLVGII